MIPKLTLILSATSMVLLVGFATTARASPTGQGQGGKVDGLQTRAERSNWQETSRYSDVIEFLDALKKSGLPHVDRIDVQTCGQSEEGRDLPVVRVADKAYATDMDAAAGQKIRILINANIHAGEVEGKEVAMILLREFASGEHAELLDQCVLWFVPIFNADGNEKVNPRNRLQQNGPDAGVGERFNGKGLDLNRDFVKVESSECRAMLGLFKRLDPHVFMDLHTTDGSAHGYQLTYAPSLSTNIDPSLDEFTRKTLLTTIRSRVRDKYGFETYDYGNFPRGRGTLRWTTYDHRPRFGTNYYGLRNRIAILSEAYSYASFERRVKVTRAFVLETIRSVSENATKIWDLCVQADKRVASGEWTFGYDTDYAKPIEDEVLVGRLDRDPGGGVRRSVADPAGLGARHGRSSASAAPWPPSETASPSTSVGRRSASPSFRAEAGIICSGRGTG